MVMHSLWARYKIILRISRTYTNALAPAVIGLVLAQGEVLGVKFKINSLYA